MSTLLNKQGVVLAETYTLLDDDTALPSEGAIIVSLARWKAETTMLIARKTPVAVKLPNTTDVLAVGAELLARPLLVLDFPAFADGRAYSQTRQLRGRCNYKAAIRATGAAVVLDQLAMMSLCGIDQFALRPDQPVKACQALLSR